MSSKTIIVLGIIAVATILYRAIPNEPVEYKLGAGQGGDYVYIGTVSATAATANTTFEMTFILDNALNGITRRKYSTNTDVGSSSMLGFFHATVGDHVSIGIRNTTSSANITINEAQFVIFKVS